MTSNVKRAYLQFIFYSLFWGLAVPDCAQTIEIADTPLEIHINEPPALLIFILDNSGSMDSELMTPEPHGRVDDRYYIFPDQAYFPGVDHTFGPGNALDSDQRRLWRTQWCGYNPLYFDPGKAYHPWPSTAVHPLGDADLHRPLSDPVGSGPESARCRMAEIFCSTIDNSFQRVDIPVAHYFTVLDEDGSEPAIYLITWQDRNTDGLLDLSPAFGTDQRRYFRLRDNGDGRIDDNELFPESDESVIAKLRPGIFDDNGQLIRYLTDTEELQNFVNWFSYHRRREFVLKNTVAVTLTGLEGILAGFYALNGAPRIPVQPVKAAAEGSAIPGVNWTILDRTEFLLDSLYTMQSRGGTPLRTALDQVGRYFHQSRTSDLGASPFWDETHGGGCQRAYAVVMTGSYWNDSFSGVGNVDRDQGVPYADDWSDTLADVASFYYLNDLAPGLPDTLSGKGCDQALHQHMVSHILSLGVGGILDPRDINDDGIADYPGYFNDPCFKDPRTHHPIWPMPLGDQPTSVDDLWHAAINSRGIYFNADQSDTMGDTMADALAEALAGMVDELDGADNFAASVEVKGEVFQAETVMYQASYRTGSWTGDLKAIHYDAVVAQGNFGAGDLLWSAAQRLDAPAMSVDSRRIVTYGGIWRSPQGIAFRYDALSADQQMALGSDLVDDSLKDRTARKLVDYLRGQEISPFRPRESGLGDIVHCKPVLVDNTVFVGANDGMLHAIDTRSGEERFGYIPGLVFRQVKHLAQNDYDGRHRFFVDATPSVADVLVDDYQRFRYLVGGLGKGGKGYYCLRLGEGQRTRNGDTFGPYENLFSVDDFGPGTSENEVAGIVQWEYPRPDSTADDMDNDADGLVDETGEEDPDMGFSFGQGYAVNANTGEEDYRPVVIFGNGYNSPHGKAVLFILDAQTGMLLRKIDTGVGEDNGLSVPALIDVDLDRRVDYVFAGDLKGNLWKFDLTAESILEWGVAYGEDNDTNGRIDAADGDLPRPLFHARNQPITGRPDIMRARTICGVDAPGFMVIFGTGKYLGFSDSQDMSQQSIYALWDYGDDSDDSEFLGFISDRNQGHLSNGLRLVPCQVESLTAVNGNPMRVLSNTAVDFSVIEDTEDGDGQRANNAGPQAPDPVADAGWFFDFPVSPDPNADPGERVIGNVVIRGGNAVVISFAPDPMPCAGGGISWVYLIKGCGGNPPDPEANPGSFIIPMTAKRYAGRLIINPAIVKTVSEFHLDQLLLSDDRGHIIKEAFLGERWGRVYWRENSD